MEALLITAIALCILIGVILILSMWTTNQNHRVKTEMFLNELRESHPEEAGSALMRYNNRSLKQKVLFEYD